VFAIRSVPRCYKQDKWTESFPRGGGFEYLHHGPASYRRQQEGNPVPRGITGPLCSRGI
jgi:hypothetical protein